MNSRARRGFSLIEALVAVVLAGGGIAALVTAIGSTERLEAKTIESEKLQRYAVQKLDEIIATADFNNQGGDFALEGEPGLEWAMSNETTSTENLETVSVTVTRADSEASGQTVSTLFYRVPTSTAAGPNR